MVDDLRTQPDRDRVAALIAAADRLATPRDFEIIDRRPIRRGGVIAAIVVAVVLLGLVSIATLGGGGDATADDRVTTTAEPRPATSGSDIAPIVASANPTARSTAPAAVPDVTASVASTNVPATSVPAPSTAPVAAVTDPGFATNLDVVPVRYAVYSGGKVYLRGRVPDRATAATIREKAAAVLGAGNVVDEYVIDPSAPVPRSAPLYIADGLLFDPDSDELAAAGQGLIDLGIALLQQNPAVTWTIEGHTDNLGSNAYNLELSQRRLDAIVSYIAAQGIDPRRLTTVAKGESEPIADNATRAGRAQNRRIEIIIEGLLD